MFIKNSKFVLFVAIGHETFYDRRCSTKEGIFFGLFMKPSSMEIDISVVQIQKEMNQNHPGDNFGNTGRLFSRELAGDEGLPGTIDINLTCEATNTCSRNII